MYKIFPAFIIFNVYIIFETLDFFRRNFVNVDYLWQLDTSFVILYFIYSNVSLKLFFFKIFLTLVDYSLRSLKTHYQYCTRYFILLETYKI